MEKDKVLAQYKNYCCNNKQWMILIFVYPNNILDVCWCLRQVANIVLLSLHFMTYRLVS